MPPHIHTIGGNMNGMTRAEAVQYAAEHGHKFVAYIPEDYCWATAQDAEELELIAERWGVSRVEALAQERWATTAPESMDYDYTYTVGEKEMHGTRWRVLVVTDPPRFERYQMMRYASGLYTCMKYKGGES